MPTRRTYASPERRLLTWARESAGFSISQAAKKVGTTPERLADWEAARARPTMNQLRKLAHIYKRPIAVFYLPTPPPDLDPPRDFRRLPGRISGVESPELRYEFRRAVARREFALELLTEAGEEIPAFPVFGQLAEPPEELGSRIREALGITMEVQSSWRSAYEPFNGWRSALEARGTLVQQMLGVEVSEARGFSISEFPLPSVVVNVKDAPRGRVFSLLHEVTHVALRLGGLCDLDDTASRSSEDLRVEQYCNAVAGWALVPAAELLSRPQLAIMRTDPTWADEELSSLGSYFGVSREVILRRLLDLDRTTDDFYRQKRQQYLEEYEAARRRQRAGFAPPHQVALASAGPAFAGLVLSSYEAGTITASDVSDYLGVRLKHLGRIEEQLVTRRSA